MMRFPQLLSWQLRWRGWLAICWAVLGRHLTQVRRLQGCPSNVIEWNRLRERRQVVFTNLRHRLESGRQFDQGRLAECCSKKADTERNSQHHSCGHLNNWISRRGRQTRGPEDEVVAVDEVRRPGRVVGRAHDRVEVELRDRGVDPVHAGEVIDRERLVVREKSEAKRS